MNSKILENKKRFADFYLQNIVIAMLCVLFMISSGCGTQNTMLDENGDKSALFPDGNDEKTDGNDEETDDNDEELTSFAGTRWKLVGIDYHPNQSPFKGDFEPKDCEDCYTLWFDTEHTVTAIGVGMRIKLDLNNLNPAARLREKSIDGKHYRINVCVSYEKDGLYYCDHAVFCSELLFTGSYSLTSDELKLFVYHPVADGDGFQYDDDYKWEPSSTNLIFKRVKGAPPTTLRGTEWKLEGMVETQTGEMKVLEPRNYEDGYTLQFNGDFQFKWRSIILGGVMNLKNLVGFDPSIREEGLNDRVYEEIWPLDFLKGDDKIYEDSWTFRRGLSEVRSYELTPGELKLFFRLEEKDYYYLFKCILE